MYYDESNCLYEFQFIPYTLNNTLDMILMLTLLGQKHNLNEESPSYVEIKYFKFRFLSQTYLIC